VVGLRRQNAPGSGTHWRCQYRPQQKRRVARPQADKAHLLDVEINTAGSGPSAKPDEPGEPAHLRPGDPATFVQMAHDLPIDHPRERIGVLGRMTAVRF
jgi:hypothetical protein